MNADSVSAALEHFAVTLEAEVDSLGWDQPASLWAIRIEDRDNLPGWADANIPALLEQAESSEHLTVAMMFSVQLEAVLEGHPVDELVGTCAADDVIAVMLCTEGWTYGPDTIAETHRTGALPTVAPADHPDSVEVRIATVVARDGTELTIQRVRDGSPEIAPLRLASGRVIWSLRRVLGRPSGVDLDALPAVADIRARARNQRIVDAAKTAASVAPQLADRVVDHLTAGGGDNDDRWLETVGLLARHWDEALTVARSHANSETPQHHSDYLAWCDAGMLAAWFDSQLATTDMLLDELQHDPEASKLSEHSKQKLRQMLCN